VETIDIHEKCGGQILNRVCQKCGKKWGKVAYMLAQDVRSEPVKFDEKAYRKRIREGRDIF